MKIINIIYKFLDKNQFTRLLMDILSFIIRKIKIKEIDEENLINIEWIKEMNISKSWFTEKKEIWISGIARIKNWDDFLEKVIESYIQFLDEIILINNKSTDQSKLICINLEKKYKNKVKFFDYDFDVLPPWTSINIPDNSIKSFVYFSNRCFSK